MIRFGPKEVVTTRDKLLGEVHQELSIFYSTLGVSPVIVTAAHESELLIDELEREYSNRI